MSKAVRAKLVDVFADRCRERRALVFVDYRGLTSSQASALRLALRADRIRVTVLKNSSAQRAFESIGWKDVPSLIQGPTAVVYGVDDPVLLSKRLLAWRDKNKVLEIRGGCIDGAVVPPALIRRLSEMPSREHILAVAVGAVASPLSAFVGTLQAVLRQFAATVKAVGERPQTVPPPAATS